MSEQEFLDKLHLLASIWGNASRFTDPGSILLLLYTNWRS